MKRIDDLSFFLIALPAILRAAWRVSRLVSRRRLDQLADELRRVPRFRVSSVADPQRLAACVERWVRWWNRLQARPAHGPCYLRSLLLLDLWARCGLHPELQIGSVQHRQGRHLHAWVTTDEGPSCGLSGHAIVWTG